MALTTTVEWRSALVVTGEQSVMTGKPDPHA